MSGASNSESDQEGEGCSAGWAIERQNKLECFLVSWDYVKQYFKLPKEVILTIILYCSPMRAVV